MLLHWQDSYHAHGWCGASGIQKCIAVTPTLSLKKSSAKKIFGSNLSLLGRKILITPTTLSDALRASRLNFSEKTLCTSLVSLYSTARNHFTQNF